VFNGSAFPFKSHVGLGGGGTHHEKKNRRSTRNCHENASEKTWPDSHNHSKIVCFWKYSPPTHQQLRIFFFKLRNFLTKALACEPRPKTGPSLSHKQIPLRPQIFPDVDSGRKTAKPELYTIVKPNGTSLGRTGRRTVNLHNLDFREVVVRASLIVPEASLRRKISETSTGVES